MTKILKETPVYIPCPACGKVQHTKLKWAQHHKSLECKDCGEDINLKKEPAIGLISKTGVLAAAYDKALGVVYEQAKRMGKLVKGDKPGKRKAKKPKSGKAAKGYKERRLEQGARPATAEPVATSAGEGQISV